MEFEMPDILTTIMVAIPCILMVFAVTYVVRDALDREDCDYDDHDSW